MRLAAHLARDRATAEDLVQSTFLAAIEAVLKHPVRNRALDNHHRQTGEHARHQKEHR